MALDINELEEVTISVRSNYRRRDVNLFWRSLLGKEPSRTGMEVFRPEKIYYHLNSDNVLTVSCREPIEIVNHEMGYRIRYILESFQHDYRSNNTLLYGMPFFEELIPRNNRQKNRWENLFTRRLGSTGRSGILLYAFVPP